MNWLDILIAIILVISIIMGIKTGLIKTVLSLAGLIVGIFLAGRFYVTLGEKLTFLPDKAAEILAYILILLVVMIFASILAAVLGKIISAIMLGWVNRLGGAIIGLCLGSLLIAAILAIWVKYAGSNNIVTESKFGKIFLDWFPVILGLLPQEFDRVRSFFK